MGDTPVHISEEAIVEADQLELEEEERVTVPLHVHVAEGCSTRKETKDRGSFQVFLPLYIVILNGIGFSSEIFLATFILVPLYDSLPTSN